jgi:UDP-GlcNAc3NAcA epimerase
MLVTILGARPQFIKAAVVSRQLKAAGIEEKILHTGQHYDENMSEVFWRELNIPRYEMNLNVGSGTHGEQTAQMISKIEKYLLDNRQLIKGMVLYGDTNSTVAGSIVASKMGIPIIHIESGLRSFNRSMPEEINRIVTDHLSEILFCPSITSVLQLQKEGITRNVFDVGDVMYDALITFSDMAENVAKNGNSNIPEDSFHLLTIHRPVNTDDEKNLWSIMNAVQQVNKKCIWPVHPRTRKILAEKKIDIPSNVVMLSPFSYFEMLAALKQCDKVITDSGGVQKEAYWMKRPCVTLRDETEWVETLDNDWNILTGARTEAITESVARKIDTSSWKPLYGDGKASDKIAAIIKELIYQ